MLSRLALLMALGLIATGCQKTGPTTASGDVALTVDASTSARITLPSRTLLPLDTTAGATGVVAGHCVLGSGATEIELERTANGTVAPTGFVWFQLHVDSPDAPVGHVMAEYEDELYEGDCELAVFGRDRSAGSLDVVVEGCPLLTPSPSASGTTSVTLSASLSFADCTGQ